MSRTNRGFSIPYPAIALHAISSTGSGPSIYCQLEETVGEKEGVGEEEEEELNMVELRIFPRDSASLQAIFDALSACAALHPDQVDFSDEDEEYEDAEESPEDEDVGAVELTEAGQKTLERLESLISGIEGLDVKGEDAGASKGN